MGCRQSVYSHNRGAEERFYIGNDRGTLYGWREGVDSELQRNTEPASVPQLSVTVRPYTLNGREERTPDRVVLGEVRLKSLVKLRYNWPRGRVSPFPDPGPPHCYVLGSTDTTDKARGKGGGK